MSYYFNQLRQFNHESLTDFKVRFEMFVETSFKDAGMEAKKPEPSEAAWHFIHRLNEQKYPNIAEETVYNVHMEIMQSPSNLDEAVAYVKQPMEEDQFRTHHKGQAEETPSNRCTHVPH